MLYTKTPDVEKNEITLKIKNDDYTFADCVNERFCHIIPLCIAFIAFVIILLCILRGTIVQWEGD